MTRWVRNRPDSRENAFAATVAGSLGVALGLVVFYLARLILARDPLEPQEVAERGEDGGAGETEG